MLCAYFGWSRNSDMPGIYAHATQEDVLRADLGKRGLLNEDDAELSPLAPLKCASCQNANPPEAIFCLRCNSPVSPRAVAEYEKRQEAKIEEILARKVASMMPPEKLPAAVRAALAGPTLSETPGPTA